jgi:SAM-dependent methyltransferase
MPMRPPDPAEVRLRYVDASKPVWEEHDAWHVYARDAIAGFVRRSLERVGARSGERVLNAGSGGIEYGRADLKHIHVDIAETRIQHLPDSIVASVESIPLPDASFRICICTGSVINYCDAATALRELARLLQPGGFLILEFENSYNPEYLLSGAFGRRAALVETFFNGRIESQWVYSIAHVKSLAHTVGLQVIHEECYHALSALAFALLRNSGIAARFALADPLLRRFAASRQFASNLLFVLQKAPSVQPTAVV